MKNLDVMNRLWGQAFCAAAQRVLTRERLLEFSRLNGAEVGLKFYFH